MRKMVWETSGEQAPDTWRALASCGGRSTRVDLQATVEYLDTRPSFGKQAMRLSNRPSISSPSTTRRLGLTTDTKGYWCGTVGMRTDPDFWRLYDKGVESKTAAPRTKWRLELEAKKGTAETIAEELKCQPEETLYSWQRCVQSWKSQGFYWPDDIYDGSLPALVRPKRPAPTAAALMRWFTASVAPTIPRALNYFTVREVLEALNLLGVAMPRPEADRGAQ